MLPLGAFGHIEQEKQKTQPAQTQPQKADIPEEFRKAWQWTCAELERKGHAGACAVPIENFKVERRLKRDYCAERTEAPGCFTSRIWAGGRRGGGIWYVRGGDRVYRWKVMTHEARHAILWGLGDPHWDRDEAGQPEPTKPARKK